MKEITLPQIIKTSWLLSAIGFLISILTQNLSIILGIIIGSLLGLLNFKILTLTIQKALKTTKVKLVILGSYGVRLTMLGLVLAIILQIKTLNFIAVIVGLSIVILAIITLGIINTFFILKGKSNH